MKLPLLSLIAKLTPDLSQKKEANHNFRIQTEYKQSWTFNWSVQTEIKETNLHTGLCFVCQVLEWISAGVKVHQLLAIDNSGTGGIV